MVSEYPTQQEMREEIARLERELAAEISERAKLLRLIQMKDYAQQVLFERLAANNVDCSDLIP